MHTQNVLFKPFFRGFRNYIAYLLGHFPGNSTFFGPPRNILDSTPDYCTASCSIENQTVILCQIKPKQSIARQLPFYADYPIEKLFKGMQTAFIKEQFVAQLRRGRYWGRTSGYIVNTSDCIHRDLSPSFEDVTYDDYLSYTHDGLNQPFLPPLQDLSGTVAVINTPFSSNFHHWLLDCVPKFGLLEKAGFNFSNIDYFILPPPTSPWHLEVLRYLQIPLDRVVSSSSKVHIRADNLIVPSFSEPSRQPERFNYTTEGLEFVRKLILTNSPKSKSYYGKIIVSRERTVCRRLMDGESIHAHLEDKGFTKVILEDYSLAEQAMIFYSANTIIMPTGGGLANLVFCRPDTTVIELFNPCYMPTFSLLLANQLKLKYIALVGDSLTDSGNNSDAGASQDIRISIERLLNYALD